MRMRRQNGGILAAKQNFTSAGAVGMFSLSIQQQLKSNLSWPPVRSFTISPSVSGLSTWNLDVNGPLILSTASSWTVVPTIDTLINIKMWGGGGGGGGHDSGDAGGAIYSGWGGAGSFIKGQINLTGSTTYTLYVGGAGAAGVYTSGGAPAGGANGGGAGSNGNSGASGQGGGGGGRTEIMQSSTPIVCAGGGGGGNGHGNGGGTAGNGNGSTGLNSTADGLYTVAIGDRGGYGGGGGGRLFGGSTSESGGAYGQTYANLVLNSSVTIATDQNAPATSETYYIAGVATGGNRTNAGSGSGTAGGLGLMVLY